MRRSILALLALTLLPAADPATAQVVGAPHATDVMLNSVRLQRIADEERKRREAARQEQERMEFERQQEQALQPMPEHQLPPPALPAR
jgi:hypothetical protein